MTVSVPGDTGAVDLYDPDEFGTGFEDVEQSDLVIPRIRIKHKDGVFVDTLTKEEFGEMTVILLRVIKQRIMWPEKLDDGDKPQCKSPNFEFGFPNTNDELPKSKRFPWEKSNFEPGHAKPVVIEPDNKKYPKGWDSHGFDVLPCANCVFQKWDQFEGQRQPLCNEQHTYPLLYTLDDGESFATALFTVSKTGIKPSKNYFSSFAASDTPMFTTFTKITLKVETRGDNVFSVPEFRKMGQTERENWRDYAIRGREIGNFIRQAPRTRDEDTEGNVSVPSENVNTGPEETPAAATTPAKASPVKAPPKAAAAAAPPPPPAAPETEEASEAAAKADDPDEIPF